MADCVIIAGGGLIGLGIAWRLAAQIDARTITVIDPAPGSGASSVAAGMLAPVTEFHFTEEALLRLNLESSSIYPGFVSELADLTGMDVGYRESGTLTVGFD